MNQDNGINDAADDASTSAPMSAWADFKQRWASVRAKLTAWWAGADRKTVVGAVFFMALVGLILWAALSYTPKRSAIEQAPVATAATAPDQQAAQISELQADVAWLLSQKASPAPDAPQRRATVAASPQPAQQPEPASAWGRTDLDRAIEAFQPPPSAFTQNPTE